MRLTRRTFLKLSGIAAMHSMVFSGNLFAGYSLKIPVLMYHDISDLYRDDYTVSPSLFASQMEWLYSNGYKTMFLKDVQGSINGGIENTVIITFDDGYASFMDYVFPLLKEYEFRATINIIGKYVGGVLGENMPMLHWDEYRHLIKSGLVDLGCHLHSLHSPADNVLTASEKKISDDISLFQEIFRREIGRSADILAWPYGKYNRQSIELARKAGFKYILTSNEGYLTKDNSLNEIPRLNINNRIDLITFQQYIGVRP